MDFSCSIGNGNRTEGRSERYQGSTLQGMMDAGSNQREKDSSMTFMLLALLVMCLVMLLYRKRCIFWHE